MAMEPLEVQAKDLKLGDIIIDYAPYTEIYKATRKVIEINTNLQHYAGNKINVRYVVSIEGELPFTFDLQIDPKTKVKIKRDDTRS